MKFTEIGGLLLPPRPALTMSSSRSMGMWRCSSASVIVAPARAMLSVNGGSPARSLRSTSEFTNWPIIGSSSTWSRSETCVPMTTPDFPV